MLLGDLRHVRGDVALGVAQAYQQEHVRPHRRQLIQATAVLIDVATSRACVCARDTTFCACEMPAVQLADVALDLPVSAHAQDLHVRLDRLEAAEQREETCTLALL